MTIRVNYPNGKRSSQAEKMHHRDTIRELIGVKKNVNMSGNWVTIITNRFEEHDLDINEVKILLALKGYKLRRPKR